MIRRSLAPAAAAAALVALACGAARAAVDQSPHDLLAQGYVSRGTAEILLTPCTFCHLSVAAGEKLPTAPPPSIAKYSRTGLVCYSCHDGTTIVSPNVDASKAAFSPDSHTLQMGGMPSRSNDLGRQELPIRGDRLECITCHAPHDNSTRPFQRIERGKLCEVCHQGYDNVGYGMDNVSGNHPLHETILDDSGQTTPLNIGAAFSVPFPANYPLGGGRDRGDAHWARGGHLSEGGEGTVECITCHPVHGGERTLPQKGLLAAVPVREKADEFCEGCHQGARSDGNGPPPSPNPGGTVTARTYHPCDDDRGNGDGRIVEIRDKVSWPMGSRGEILCTTCHVPHGGMRGTPALRRPVNALTFCEECHLAKNLPAHHPSGETAEGKRTCLQPPDPFRQPEEAAGGIYCSSCHLAHNAGLGKDKAEDYVPILRIAKTGNDLCFLCHYQENPTCNVEDEGKASHFMGDPTLPDTYASPNPPLRTALWPATKQVSRYGGENRKEIICLSCHTFISSPGMAGAGPLPHYLLAEAGNNYEWEGSSDNYLCTGCHGASPTADGKGEGQSHPMASADVTALSIEAIPPPVSRTPKGHLNCDSCHRSHGAFRGSSYYILETVITLNEDPKAIHPQIDYLGLCRLCHPEKE